MITNRIGVLLAILMSMVVTKTFAAYDIAVENEDGVIIYYNYINDGRELEVTKGLGYQQGIIVIPSEVTFMNRTRKVTSIGKEAFKGCGVTSISIPNSVTSIGGGAFKDCMLLKSLTIPNGVTTISYSVFSGCTGLTSLTIPNGVTSIGVDAFNSCSGLTSITIPNSVTSIGNNAFDGCWGLTSLTIPNSVTSIGDSAFRGCSGLTSVTISNSVTFIRNYTFLGCRSLTSVTIPSSVTTIGENVFFNCSSLTSVTIGKNVTSIGRCAFSKVDIPTVISLIENPFEIYGKSVEAHRTFSLNTFNNATLYVPKGTIEKYKATEGWKDFLFIEEGDGITNVTHVEARAVMINTDGGQLSIEGADDNTDITAYTLDGVQLGSAVSRNGVATINTNVSAGTVTIVKIGNKSVKVAMR